jgi:GTP-binding protein
MFTRADKITPIIVIHGNALDAVGDVYKRYLKHFETFSLVGTPLRINALR